LKTNPVPEAELRIVADNMPAAALRCSRDLRFLWVNPLCASCSRSSTVS
jgi:PAS domain-containing protein